MSTENAATESDIRSIQTKIESQKEEFWAKIEDAREKIITVKKEVDGKADEDHNHSEYVEEDYFTEEIESMESSICELIEEVEEIENTNEDFSEKLDILAHNLLSHRDRLRKLEAELENKRTRERNMDKILSDARNINTNSGICESCSEKISISRLRKPECPYCSQEITGMTSRFLVSDVFNTSETEDAENEEDEAELNQI